MRILGEDDESGVCGWGSG